MNDQQKRLDLAKEMLEETIYVIENLGFNLEIEVEINYNLMDPDYIYKEARDLEFEPKDPDLVSAQKDLWCIKRFVSTLEDYLNDIP